MDYIQGIDLDRVIVGLRGEVTSRSAAMYSTLSGYDLHNLFHPYCTFMVVSRLNT